MVEKVDRKSLLHQYTREKNNKIIVLVLTYTLLITAIYIYTQIIRIVHKFASTLKDQSLAKMNYNINMDSTIAG